MINPSDIDLKSLPFVYLSHKKKLPKQPGIYFVLDNDSNVKYIGRTENFYQRWSAHHRYDEVMQIDNVKISYLYVDNVNLLPAIERALIIYFNPSLNGRRKVISGVFRHPIYTLTHENLKCNVTVRKYLSPEESKHGKPKYPRMPVTLEPELRKEIKELMKLRNIPNMTVVINEALRMWADAQ